MKINGLVAKGQKTPEEGWTMADGTPWPGNNPRDHPGMIQVYSDSHSDAHLLQHTYLCTDMGLSRFFLEVLVLMT